jgi:dUTP pyrophosphatase
MKIELKVLNKQFYEGCTLPHYQTSGSAAMDLYCTKDITIYPGETKMIATGIAVHTNGTDVAALILPRSGLGTKGLVLANTIGLIDSDYQGELKIAAWNRLEAWERNNTNNYPVMFNTPNWIDIKAGDRIAQLMFVPIIKAEFDIVEDFNTNTQRGVGGFGHTGG